MKFLLKYPSRERPELFATTVSEWQRRATHPDRLQWLVSLDSDDPTLSAYRHKCDALDIDPILGTSKNKIEAVNRDMDRAGDWWDVLVVVSDDMLPVVDGWDDIIERHMPTLDMGLWFIDGRQNELCTLSIFGRPIYDWMKCIYHPSFESVYADNYYHFVMECRGKLKRIGASVFEHQWKKQNDDALMKRNEDPITYKRDHDRFVQMKAKFLETGIAF